ncbi:DUF6545 domain-containing protein [Pseudonocardia alni]|uniref:DUF6545 domain-containing protein n=1 Tax=Pseudonocardia alni TaxID=33907 RepID=UPI0036753C06
MTAAAVWQWRQVRRHPGDNALKALAVGVSTIAFVLLMSVTDVPATAALHHVLDAVSFSNIAWTLLFYIYSIFFLLATADDDRVDPVQVHRRVILEFGVYLLFIVPGLFALLSADPGFFGKNRDPATHPTLRNIVYYVGVSGYPILAWTVGTLRAVRYLRLLSHRGARVATIGVVAALGLMMLGVNGVSLIRQGLYIVYPGSRWPPLRVLYNAGRLSGQVLLVLSIVSVPLTAAFSWLIAQRRSWGERRLARELAPLWATLVEEFPHVRLPVGALESPDHLARRPPLDRMMIEISDGLAYLAEWSTAPQAGGEVADQVGSALEAKRWFEQAPWTGSSASVGAVAELPSWEPDFAGDRWRARATWMVGLAKELRDGGLLHERMVTR